MLGRNRISKRSGIIKNNGLVVTAKQENCVMNVAENECCEKNARLIKADRVTEYEISLDGEYQRENAAVAEGCAGILTV